VLLFARIFSTKRKVTSTPLVNDENSPQIDETREKVG